MYVLLRKAVVKAVIVTALIVAGNAYAHTQVHADPTAAWKAHSPSQAYHAHAHECWIGAQPAWFDGIPTHAIISTPTRAWHYSPRATAALEHVFEDKHPGLDVQAFCV